MLYNKGGLANSRFIFWLLSLSLHRFPQQRYWNFDEAPGRGGRGGAWLKHSAKITARHSNKKIHTSNKSHYQCE